MKAERQASEPASEAIDKAVVEHYRQDRDGAELVRAILEALKAAGKDVDALSAADLASLDEFHLGWRAATFELADGLRLTRGMSLLDIGSGLGGPARYFAEARGCEVVGVDLTESYVEAARTLTDRCGLAERVRFLEASALALPFEDASFDRATLIHVGMNIEDKRALFAEARRVLKPGGRFGVYDVMRMGEGAVAYPTPWATSAEVSFLESVASYRKLLAQAGFTLEAERNRLDLTLRLAEQMRAHAEKNGPPALGLHVLMGADARPRMANIMRALRTDALAPVELIARAGD